MKILMTGANARSIGSTRVRYDYVQFHQIVREALEELGHEVDMRPVFEAEDVRCYDRALVHVGAPSSLSNGYLPGAAHTLAVMEDRARVYVDDWSAERLADDIAAHVERQKGWERHVNVFRPKEWSRLGHVKHVNAARRALLRFLDIGGPPWPIAGPFFNWGDRTGFFQTGKRKINAVPIGIDPSPDIYHLDEARDLPKDRRWILATLQNHDRWLEDLSATWPIDVLGAQPKAVGGVRLATAQNPVVSEADVQRAYGAAWGVLSPWYKTAGTGWWRARFNFATEVGSILFCGDADGEAIGPAFTVPVAEVEELLDHELEALAEAQQSELWAYESSHDELLQRLDEFVA